MADIPEVLPTDPQELLATGRRHLAVKDYSNAVTCLGKACELLAEKFGQQADECGEAYFWYGKSLLGLAREESGVLGDGIPGGEENQDDDEEDEEAADEDNDDADKESGEKTESSEETKESKEAEAQEPEESAKKPEPMQTELSAVSGSDDAVPSSSTAGPSSSAAGPSSSNAEEAENDEEDDIENLQLAWEVFELARDVFLKRGDKGKKELADVYLHLGEVSLESETYEKAISDMGKSLELFVDLYSNDDRRIAETHYQIGLAHSLSNGFDDAIEHFKSAANILETRIRNLQSLATKEEDADEKKGDPFYSVDGEIKEITDLLPEIKEKIQDMIDYKAEAIKSVKETLGLSKTNGESVSKQNGSSSSGPDKKVSDISHLIKRKRVSAEGVNSDECTAAKRPAN